MYGKKYWLSRWQQKQKAIDNLPMEDFRNNRIGRGLYNVGEDERLLGLAGYLCKYIGVSSMRDSLVGNPKFTTYEGVPITKSSLEHAYMTEEISRNVKFEPLNVLEIGGGFGGLAWMLSKKWTIDRYVLVDHPSCLTIQKWFLSQVCPADNFEFLTPDQLDEIGTVELAINTRSFGEMDLVEVQTYMIELERLVSPGGYFFTINWNKKIIEFEDIPIDYRLWREVFRKDWPRFIDANPMVEALYLRTNENLKREA